MKEKQFLTISEVSQWLKIPKHTLRFWEGALGGAFSPPRTKGGQRRFTLEEIAVIEKVNKLRDQGIGLFKIKEELQKGNGDHGPGDKIDLLASRIAEAVKAEVYNFFRKE